MTDRDITLRVPELADAPAIAAAVQSSRPELAMWMDWCSEDYDVADAVGWVQAARDARQRNLAYEFVIEGQGGAILGCCGLNAIDTLNRRANLGYWVRTEATGRGVARAAAAQAIAYAFTHTELQRLEIVVAVDNAPSLAVAAALGAWQEGVLVHRLAIGGRFHDAVLFAIIRGRGGSPR